MNDQELIKLIAEIWVCNGGDSDGFGWCYDKILKEIESHD